MVFPIFFVLGTFNLWLFLAGFLNVLLGLDVFISSHTILRAFSCEYFVWSFSLLLVAANPSLHDHFFAKAGLTVSWSF